MKLLDSTFLIDLLNEDSNAKGKIESEKDTNFFITDLSIYKVALGIHRLEIDKAARSLSVFKDLINSLNYLALTTEASFKAAKIKADLIKKGITIDDVDCLIAAIGLMNNINIIVTRNIKHFSVIKNLKVENY